MRVLEEILYSMGLVKSENLEDSEGSVVVENMEGLWGLSDVLDWARIW